MKNISNFKRRESNNFPYIIAEIGVNHECSLSRAKKLIDLAANAGASAAKFQTYKAEKLASKNSPSYWDTKKEKTLSQFKLFKKFDKFDYKHYKKLFHHCKKKKIDFASTPFDVDSVNFLNPFLKYFKVASADINNLPLLKAIGKKRKPVILSTGASYINEIKFALRYLKKFGCPKIVIMHCILNYPTKNENANLRMIKGLKKNFPKNIIGYSDHTAPDINLSSLLTAYTLGAVVLEKNFTYNKSLSGNDHYHSMDYKNLFEFKKILEKVFTLLGKKDEKTPILSENIARKNARRSIVLKKEINIGKKFETKHLICKRPGTGISPIYWDRIIGKFPRKKLKIDHILQWSDIKK